MRKLDIHLARSFLEPFLVATAAIAGLYMVADAFSNLDEFLREAGSVHEALFHMARIYLIRIPVFLCPVVPISMLVGAAYGVAQLSAHNELVAMQACGVSFWRILAPIYAAAVFVALLGFANRELVAPRVEQMVRPELLLWKGEKDDFEHVVDYIESERTQYTMMYNVATRRARNVFILRREPDGTASQTYARRARPVKDGWLLEEVQTGDGRMLKETVWRTSLTPADVELRLLPPDVRPIGILHRLIKREPDNPTYRLYYHLRLAYPFTGLVLVGLGLPFVIANDAVRRSRMLGVGVCIIISMVFYGVQFIVNDLGRTGQLPPALAAWLPILVFGALGIYMLDRVHG